MSDHSDFLEVVFRAIDFRGVPRVYVAYLMKSLGEYFAVLSQDDEGFGLPSSPKLDPSRLEERTDDVSGQQFYLYLGVLDVRQ
jgi:hypothetical protein